MNKIIKSGKEAQDSVISGVNQVADIVKTTLGPKGRNILITDEVENPVITNDGVTIAKSIQLKDKFENAGARFIINAASKTNEVAGDGTTTTTLLTQEIIHQYNQLVDKNDNPVQIQKQINNAAKKATEYLKLISEPIDKKESIEKVATISSGDKELGKLIADAYNEEDLKSTSISIEDSDIGITTLEKANGMQFNQGMISEFFYLDNTNHKTEIDNVKVFISKDALNNISDIIGLLNYAAQTKCNLLILCDDMSTDLIQNILINKVRGAFANISVVRLPGFNKLRDDLMADLAIATGATVFGNNQEHQLKEFNEQNNEIFLGEAEKIIITDKNTTIKFKDTLGKSAQVDTLKKAREERIKELKSQLVKAKEEDKLQYRKRIANLSGGLNVIKVGAATKDELKDKKYRIEDALNSVRSAVESGIVPGGGYSFVEVYNHLKEIPDKDKGATILMNALPIITKQIAENAGRNSNEVLEKCIKEEKCYNAETDTFVKAIESGIINSYVTDSQALLNAASTAGILITMGGAIVSENEKDQNVLQLQGPIQGFPVMQ